MFNCCTYIIPSIFVLSSTQKIKFLTQWKNITSFQLIVLCSFTQLLKHGWQIYRNCTALCLWALNSINPVHVFSFSTFKYPIKEHYTILNPKNCQGNVTIPYNKTFSFETITTQFDLSIINMYNGQPRMALCHPLVTLALIIITSKVTLL